MFSVCIFCLFSYCKHGQDNIKNVQIMGKLKTKLMKLKTGIGYIKLCKKEESISAFTKVNLSIKSGGYKLKKKVAKPVVETELQDKHYQSRKTGNGIRSINISLKWSLGLVLWNAIVDQIEIAKRGRLTSMKKRHEKKLLNLRK